MGRKQLDQSVRERVEAFIQPMPAHEIAPIDLQARYTLDRRASRALVAAVCAIAAVVLIGLGIGWLRDTPAATPTPMDPLAAHTPSSPTPPPTPAPPPPPPEVVVSVQGLVAKPGLLRLPTGVRVGEAIDRAGGPSSNAALHQVNLAEVAQDGMQILVDEHGSSVVLPGATPPAAPAQPQSVEPGKINLNTASASELESLPGIGPATAQAIISHRDSNGPFATADGLLEVRGIGPAKFNAIKDLVTAS